jgi:hypothetical protein
MGHFPVYDWYVTELRVVVPDEIAKRLAAEGAARGISAEDMAAEVLAEHVPEPKRLRLIALGHSAHHDTAARSEEILLERFAR